MLITTLAATLALAAGPAAPASARGKAPAAPDVPAMLDCWAKAAGGRERLQALKVVEREGTYEQPGQKGAFHNWVRTADGAVVERGSLGPSTWREGFDGKRAWAQPGLVPSYELSGAELEATVSDGYFRSFSALVPGRMPGEVRAGSAPWTLVLAPQGGREWTVALDPATCLPKTTVRRSGDRTVTVTHKGWVAEGGVKFPSLVEVADGHPDTLLKVRFEKTRLDGELPEVELLRPPYEPLARIPAGKGPVELRAELTQNHVYLPLKVNGLGPSWFLIDTGADRCLMDSAVAAKLGLKGEGMEVLRGAGKGSIQSSMVARPKIGWGPLEIATETLYTAPFDAISLREGRVLEGIIGFDVLSQFVVEFDYAAPAVRLHDPASFQAPPGAVSLPFTLHNTKPVVEVSLDLGGGRTATGKVMVDTGARSALVLNAPFVERLRALEVVGKTLDAPLGFGVGGRTSQLVGRVASVRLGSAQLEAPLTSFAKDVHGAMASPDLDGLIGGDLLRRFTAYFDYGRSQMLLVKNATSGVPFEYDMSGMYLQSRDLTFQRLVVGEVIPGSPAAEAGVRAGDELQQLDGQPVDGKAMEAIREGLRVPGRAVKARLLRGGKPVEVTFTTRRLI